MLNTVETPAVLASRNMAVRSTFASQKDTLNYLRACKHKNIEPYSDLPMSSTVFMVFDTFEYEGRVFATVYERAPALVASALLVVELDETQDVINVLIGTTLRENIHVDHAYPMMLATDADTYFGVTFTVAGSIPSAALGVFNPVPARVSARLTLLKGE
jgi:hypothetical protein